MSVDFSKLTSRPLDTVKRPPALPAGSYLGSISKYEFGDQNKNNTPYCRYHFRLSGPADGMSQEDLDTLSSIDLSKRQMRRDFFLTEDADWRHKEFLQSLGIKTEGRTFAETIPESLNGQVLIEVQKGMSQRTEADGTVSEYNQVGNVKGV